MPKPWSWGIKYQTTRGSLWLAKEARMRRGPSNNPERKCFLCWIDSTGTDRLLAFCENPSKKAARTSHNLAYLSILRSTKSLFRSKYPLWKTWNPNCHQSETVRPLTLDIYLFKKSAQYIHAVSIVVDPVNLLLGNVELLVTLENSHSVQQQDTLDLSTQFLHKDDGSVHSSSCCQNVINYDHPISLLNDILLNFNHIFSVL